MTDETKTNEELTNKEKQKKVQTEVTKTRELEQKVKMIEQQHQQLMAQQQPPQPQSQEPEPEQPNDQHQMIRQTISQQMQEERQQQMAMQQQQEYQKAFNKLVSSDNEAKELSDNIQQKNGGYDTEPTYEILHYIANSYKDNVQQKMMKEVLKNDDLRNKLIKNFALKNYDKVYKDITDLSNVDNPAITEAPKNEAPDLSQHSNATLPKNKSQKEEALLNAFGG